jgi:uncharacterized protein YbbC (DUF1343 family)
MCASPRRRAASRPSVGSLSNIRCYHAVAPLFFSGLVLSAACGAGAPDAARAETASGASIESSAEQTVVRPGIEVLLSDSLHLVEGRRVGLVTNHTGMDSRGRSDIDLLIEQPGVRLVALFGPEHGIRGDIQDGIAIASDVDERTGIPVHSLYGSASARKPSPEQLEGLDVLLFDMQDIGARYYTYMSTMALAMEAAGENGIPFVVLDRPNPIRGDVVQGNVLDPDFSTFVGMFPVPMRHGMTPGELAGMYVGHFEIEVELHVVPIDGWERSLPFDETGLPWVAPSTNMPSLTSALAYPGTCLFEGTVLSVGRGTERAFQWVGAPWIDGTSLADALNTYGFADVRFEPVTFTPETPSDAKFDGVEVHGVRVVSESSAYDAPRVAVAMLVEARKASGDRWEWTGTIDRLAGTDALRLGVDAGRTLQELTAGWDEELRAFERLRAPYLLY